MAPLAEACCGCSLTFACKVVLVIHSLTTFFYLVSAWCSIVLEIPDAPGHNLSLFTQTLNFAFALATVPFLISGYMALSWDSEIHLRVYLYWFLFSSGTDFVCYIILLVKNTCTRIPSMLAEQGGSWSCGVMRGGAICFVLLALSIIFYLAYILWSLCEAYHHRSSSDHFSGIYGVRAEQKRREDEKFALRGVGLFGCKTKQKQMYPAEYGSLSAPIFAGGSNIFGDQHDTHYPPTRAPLTDHQQP